MNVTSLFCLTLGAVAVTVGVGCSGDSTGNTGGTGNGNGGASAGGASSGGAAMGGANSGGNASTSGGTSTGGGSGGGAAGAATGGAATGGAPPGGRPPEIPPTESQADIATFVKSGAYKNTPWISETSTPRAGTLGSQHGGKVRVWENPTLVNALKAGHDGLMGHPFPDQWSMAVKELYDEAGTNLLGTAVALKNIDNYAPAAWIYYCVGPGIRCNSTPDPTEAMPIYGNGASNSASECGFCHGGMIFTKPP